MRRALAALTPALVGLVVVSAPVLAQGPGPSPPRRPALSPYLNLLRGGNSAVNYYGLVRPQNEFRAANNQLQNSVNRLQSEIDQTQALQQSGISQLQATGHKSGFNTHRAYFFTNASGRMGR